MTTTGFKSDVDLFAGNGDGPVFSAPWQAQIFSMTVRLYQGGHFSRQEWSQRLGREIELSTQAGEADTEETYYQCWLRAFEKLVADKKLLTEPELEQRRQAWDRAARATPHGQPISLENHGQAE